jgi:prepilin-type N-terminal cleavage/methylation domain-containing protein
MNYRLCFLTGAKNMKIIKNKTGFTLIEVLVSTALFTIIMTAAMDIFKLVIESQRSAVATQNVEESLKYFLEVTGKEVRMAKRNNGLCSGLAGTDIYNTSGTNLTFRNYHDQCVSYALSHDDATDVTRFAITRDGVTDFITPAKINVDELHFVVRSQGITAQPTVTMELVAHALGKDIEKSTMRIQTTLSSRYYKAN